MHKLPPLPNAIRVLRADESARLDSLFTDNPKSLDQCVTCFGKKTFRWYDEYGTADAQIVDYECPCADQFVLFKYLLNAGLGKQAQRLMLGDCTDVDPHALAAINDYEENSAYYVSRGTGLLFHGSHGSGKTLLATLLFKYLLGEGVDGHFTTFLSMLDNFAAGWRSDDNRLWFDKRVRNAPLLVVDDIGRGNPNLDTMAGSALDAIFRSRVQNSLPTIITTNLTPYDLERRYSSGVFGLVTETSLSYEFSGESFRDHKMREKTERETKLMLSRPITIS